MTDADRLNAILDRLGVIETNSATAHAKIEGGINVLTERVSTLADRVAIQNGRVTKLEGQVGELQMHVRIAQRDDAEQDERHDFLREKVVALLTGSFLVIHGAALGYFL